MDERGALRSTDPTKEDAKQEGEEKEGANECGALNGPPQGGGTRRPAMSKAGSVDECGALRSTDPTEDDKKQEEEEKEGTDAHPEEEEQHGEQGARGEERERAESTEARTPRRRTRSKKGKKRRGPKSAERSAALPMEEEQEDQQGARGEMDESGVHRSMDPMEEGKKHDEEETEGANE